MTAVYLAVGIVGAHRAPLQFDQTRMTTRFDSPKAIVTGGGSRRQAGELLSSLHAHRPLIVVDPYFATADFVVELRAADVFTDFQPDPTDLNVAAGVERFRETQADSIVAIG